MQFAEFCWSYFPQSINNQKFQSFNQHARAVLALIEVENLLVFPKRRQFEMSKHMQISYEDWEQKYIPARNHLDQNASWNGVMYETYGVEYEYVKRVAQKDPQSVWTLVDDGENATITNGLLFVNRMGYFVTVNPLEEDITFMEVLD